MAKKIFLTIISAIVFVIGLATVSFAKTGTNTTVSLGNEVSKSINKTERNMDDLVDDTGLNKAGKDIQNGVEDLGNNIRNGFDNMGRDAEDLVDANHYNDTDDMRNTRNTDDRIDNKLDNKAVAGRTGNYTAGQVQTGVTARNGMSQNAWIWIVMVVVALVIIAAVWFYAAQRQ